MQQNGEKIVDQMIIVIFFFFRKKLCTFRKKP